MLIDLASRSEQSSRNLRRHPPIFTLLCVLQYRYHTIPQKPCRVSSLSSESKTFTLLSQTILNVIGARTLSTDVQGDHSLILSSRVRFGSSSFLFTDFTLLASRSYPPSIRQGRRTFPQLSTDLTSSVLKKSLSNVVPTSLHES